jgi:hypothetical protein
MASPLVFHRRAVGSNTIAALPAIGRRARVRVKDCESYLTALLSRFPPKLAAQITEQAELYGIAPITLVVWRYCQLMAHMIRRFGKHGWQKCWFILCLHYHDISGSPSQNLRVDVRLLFDDFELVDDRWQPSVEKLNHGPPERHLFKLARVALLVQSASE